VRVVVAILETPMRTYWLYSAPDCGGLFAFYDGAAAFDRVPRTVLKELAAAKRAGAFRAEVREAEGEPVYSGGRCVGVRLRPRVLVVRGPYGIAVMRGRPAARRP